ncbi:hypothetical protein COV04_01175 [Candidatus Uhrbacteria bacterium CG10_big_fil_rev_8_21_14_0_10_48_11]|uniref:Cation-transporting P-type ATPase C-terminal domain-containing protein n=1 Tax=Candidatus Uhrbacteria bacterium CG10_big_fil_rev_8_21_14_0_10_48_11 TaxID=1975037 RepID=A0A2M8LF97_9BACT|nr:MAG: hypothetical protein COV04_01175 [Candidatus Uhrbacteria bacterium CG10_big_fil_rev_8_21_14_0_10_48_11]
MPVQKEIGGKGSTGTFLVTGWSLAEVTATGALTAFSKTLMLVEGKRSLMEEDIPTISKFLGGISVTVAILLTTVSFLWHVPLLDILTLDVSLFIAGIPVALPTVTSLIISIGVVGLTAKNVIVRRLSSLEELANVTLLLSDKTGTLTENTIAVERVITYSGDEKHNLALAAATVAGDNENPIDRAVLTAAKAESTETFERTQFILADSSRKRATATLTITGKAHTVAFGASQVVEALCTLSSQDKKRFAADVAEAAENGYRVLALAEVVGDKEKAMTLVALLLLSDTIRPESSLVISFLQKHGIATKMVIGDNEAITTRAARVLQLVGPVIRRADFATEAGWNDIKKRFDAIGGFAEILPEDKYRLVQFARTKACVSVTGDGVNDLPAVKAASVGIAVKNAVDALKGAADIVLLTDGITVIRDAVIEARKIFQRLYNYSVYRISESFRVIITVAVLGLLYGDYPLTPVQLILLALLNDLPIIALAVDRVRVPEMPAKINVRARFLLSSLFGLAGIMNSLMLFFIAVYWWHLPWGELQTMSFLKLTVSGHMLIYVAHTDEPWYKFFPSRMVMVATIGTQLIVTAMAATGVLTSQLSWPFIIFVWLWSFFWMQISELMKHLQRAVRSRYANFFEGATEAVLEAE